MSGVNGRAGIVDLLRRSAGSAPAVFFTGGPWVGRQAGYTPERLLTDPVALADAQCRVHEKVGQDAVLAYFDPLYIPEAYGCRIRFLESGALTSAVALTEVEARSPGVDEGRMPVILEAVARLSRWSGGSVAVGTLLEGPLTTLSRVVGTEAALRLIIRDPSAVESALARVTEVLVRFARAAVAVGAELLVAADPVSSPAMISPAMYERFVQPALTRFFDAIPAPVVLHVCGDTRPILRSMAATGAAALSLDQCIDLSEARGLVGADCALAGNVSPSTLSSAAADAVTRESLAAIVAASPGPHVLMPGCGVPPESPLENVVAMVRAARAEGQP